jgi:hypothetical protein
MSQTLTKNLTDNNIDIVRKQIMEKKKSYPYYGTSNVAESVVGDMDVFPYTRFYRGVYYSSDPVVFEREASWRSPQNSCYGNSKGCCAQPLKSENCWQIACSTVLPCKPPKSDYNYLNSRVDCVVNYR